MPVATETTIEIRDPRFSPLVLVNSQLERLWTGGRWCEGPVYVPAGRYLLFSDIPNDRTMRYDEPSGRVAVFEQPARNQNGHTLDRHGRVVSCEHRARAVTRIAYDGHREVLADSFDGKRLNSPNDVVVRSDGSVWFSDPTYGIDSDYEGDRSSSEIGASNVYRIDPESGSVTAVITDMVQPNGLAFSPDESVLYVADTGATHQGPACPPVIRSYAMKAGLPTGASDVFATCEQGLFDGFRIDVHGNLWTSAGDGVHCFAADGTLLGKIHVPEAVANLELGGPKRNRLYICATTSLYAIYVNTRA